MYTSNYLHEECKVIAYAVLDRCYCNASLAPPIFTEREKKNVTFGFVCCS